MEELIESPFTIAENATIVVRVRANNDCGSGDYSMTTSVDQEVAPLRKKLCKDADSLQFGMYPLSMNNFIDPF